MACLVAGVSGPISYEDAMDLAMILAETGRLPAENKWVTRTADGHACEALWGLM